MNWLQRLVAQFGKDTPIGASKHNRARRKPRNWKIARKARRKTEYASRKRNR